MTDRRVRKSVISTRYSGMSMRTRTEITRNLKCSIVSCCFCLIYCTLTHVPVSVIHITMKLSEFINITFEKEKLVDFLIEHNVLPNVIKCTECGTDININKKTLKFTCWKRQFVKNIHKKRVTQQCKFKRSAKIGTWFKHSHIDIGTICRLTAYFIILPPPRQRFLQFDSGLSSKTVVDWINFCREVCVYYAESHSQKLGGPGLTVEIDEAKIGRRKYNRGRLITGNWIFGGIERNSKKIFIVPVQDRTQETLLNCIKEWILPGTRIISDCWKSYNCLNNEDFQHLTVNHSYNFVDPDTGAHTQNIERVWREVRANIPRYGTKSAHFLGYLSEYLFKRIHILEERIEIFFDTIAQLYPPDILSETENEEESVPSTSSTNMP